MGIKSEKIIFIGGGRDYHTMDWYRTVKEVCADRKVIFVTDMIESEGFQKLVKDDDCIIELFNIDRFLFPIQSKYEDAWRNLVKIAFFPLQTMRLKSIAKNNPNSVFHALPMYYMFLCWAAGVPYVGTPQGSEILVRPNRSRLYKYFAVKCLTAARHITVDSVGMRDKIFQLCGKGATVIQNGIDVATILRVTAHQRKREHVVSIRGITPLYRIDAILEGREYSRQKPKLLFIYPFVEGVYKSGVSKKFLQGDTDLGRLPKTGMYELLCSSKLVISIPMSDSSPRSVYESIFCGCCVAVTYNPWIDVIPDCMKARLFIADISDKLWLEKALDHAESVTRTPYIPSEAALNMFDKNKTLKILADKFY